MTEWRASKQHRDSQKGLTVVEMVVAVTLFALFVVAITGTMNTIQQAQRSERYLDLANTAAREIIEKVRNGGYDAVAVGNHDFTTSVPEAVPGRAATLTVTSSSDLPEIKKLEVDVSYDVGTLKRHVYMTALIGKGGISP